MNTTPSEIGMLVYKAIYNTGDITDPFKDIKEQRNYETICDQNRPLFFLLKVKCPVITRDIGITCGSMY